MSVCVAKPLASSAVATVLQQIPTLDTPTDARAVKLALGRYTSADVSFYRFEIVLFRICYPT